MGFGDLGQGLSKKGFGLRADTIITCHCTPHHPLGCSQSSVIFYMTSFFLYHARCSEMRPWTSFSSFLLHSVDNVNDSIYENNENIQTRLDINQSLRQVLCCDITLHTGFSLGYSRPQNFNRKVFWKDVINDLAKSRHCQALFRKQINLKSRRLGLTL